MTVGNFIFIYLLNKVGCQCIRLVYLTTKDKIMCYYWHNANNIKMIKFDPEWHAELEKTNYGKVEQFLDWVIL